MDADMTGSSRLIVAFPSVLHPDALVVLAAMPPADLADAGGVEVSVEGEHVEIPGRIYHPEPSGDRAAALSSRQRTILWCLYTRHHDGFVRQWAVQRVIGSMYVWVVPFVLQLVGEYVVEIILIIRDALSDLETPSSTQHAVYGRFLAENPAFLELTSQRVASYWDCYYRTRYPVQTEYPGFSLLSSLRAAARQAT